MAALKEIGVPVGPINKVEDVVKDPSIVEREMIISVEHPVAGHLEMPGVPIKMSDTPGSVDRPAPVLGADTASILKEMLGFDDAKIEELYKNEVI